MPLEGPVILCEGHAAPGVGKESFTIGAKG